MWSASHGLARNCTRWVTSCRQTHSRKSAGTTRSCRSTAITLGYTSSSSPPLSANGSYWPRMPDETNASTAPVWAPVTRPVMKFGLSSFSLPPVITRMDCVAALTHSERSMMRASDTAAPSLSPVTSRTGISARIAELAELFDRLPAGVVGGRRRGPDEFGADGGGESPVDGAADGHLACRAHGPHPHDRSTAASASREVRPVGPASLESSAKVSTRPLASVTMPASELVAVNDPVLALQPARPTHVRRRCRGSGSTVCRCRRRSAAGRPAAAASGCRVPPPH